MITRDDLWNKVSGTEANTVWLLQVHHIHLAIPRKLIIMNLQRIIHSPRPILSQQAVHSAAPRTAICPKEDGFVHWVLLSLDKPIMNLRIISRHQVARILLKS